MRIIEIKTLENGAHINACGEFDVVPEGCAVVPDDMETPNFPFGEVEAEEIDGVMTVTKWTAGTTPEPEAPKPSFMEQMRADIDFISIMSGVDL